MVCGRDLTLDLKLPVSLLEQYIERFCILHSMRASPISFTTTLCTLDDASPTQKAALCPRELDGRVLSVCKSLHNSYQPSCLPRSVQTVENSRLGPRASTWAAHWPASNEPAKSYWDWGHAVAQLGLHLQYAAFSTNTNDRAPPECLLVTNAGVTSSDYPCGSRSGTGIPTCNRLFFSLVTPFNTKRSDIVDVIYQVYLRI